MSYGTNGLSFRTHREANKKRLPLFKNKKGKKAHSKKDGSDWTPAEWLEAVVGELGEYANIRKKFRRGDMDEKEFKILAAKELADVQIYFDILAFRLGIDLEKAVRDKFNEKSKELGIKVFLGEDDDWHYQQ
jgi:NTP pyrophosphatase (non-canonical NTP hydrolase)